MTPETFIAEFGVLVETAGGPAKLKELVFDLAVRGRLARQNDDDGTLPGLLENKRARRGTIQAAPAQHFDIPASWQWACVAQLGVTQTGTTPSTKDPVLWGGDLPFITPGDINEGRIGESKRSLSPQGMKSGRLLPAGSVLMVCIGGSLGKTACTPVDVSANQQINAVTPQGSVFGRYVAIALSSTYFQRDAWARAGKGTLPILNKSKWGQLAVPVPPLPEQKRIVEKVDQLMALCDELEERQAKKRKTVVQLNKAALNAVVQAPDAKTLRKSWKRVEDNFEVLYDRVETVEELRETITAVAMQGKLTVRRGGGQDGHELLDDVRYARREAWETEQLDVMATAGKKARTDAWKERYKPAAQVDPSDQLIAGVPTSWAKASLGEIAEIIDPNPSHRYPSYKNGSIPLLSTREMGSGQEWDLSRGLFKKVPAEVHLEQAQRCRFSPSDIIFARKGRLGLARHPPVLERYTFSHTLFVIKPSPLVRSDFLVWHLQSRRVVEWLLDAMNSNTGVPTLGKAFTERLPVPMPPVHEQERIVESIVRLMALCDDLDAKLKQSGEDGKRLMQAVVEQLVA